MPDVARDVAHGDGDEVGARRRLGAVVGEPAVPRRGRRAGRGGEARDHARRAAVRAQHPQERRPAARRFADGDADRRPGRGPDDPLLPGPPASPSRRLDARARRRRVEPDVAREGERAALAAEADPDVVDAVGRARARVVAAVPAQPQRDARAAGPAPTTSRRTGVAPVVHDRHRDVVALLDAHAHRAGVAPAVAVRREVLDDVVQPDHGRRALEPLRDEEGREGRAHQQHEDGAGDDGHGELRRLVGSGQDDHVGARAPAPAPRRSPAARPWC